MKEIYIKPETIYRMLLLESVFNNLSSKGDGNWAQALNDDEEYEDEGRTKERGLWEDTLW